MNSKLISIVVVLVLIAGGFLLFKNKSVAPNRIDLGMPVPGSDVDEMIVNDDTTDIIPTNVKEFSVDATSFSFTPNTMTVNKGDVVKITLKNIKGNHDLKIDEFNASTRVLKAEGEEETITFVTDKAGTFEYYCSVGNHRTMGMVGTLIVR